MPKSLGQIHTVNDIMSPITVAPQLYNIDLAGSLTEQLQRMVRAGTFHKLVGMDITVRPTNTTIGDGVQLSGRIRYFVPTRGRCEAFRGAFRSMAEIMKTQGISMGANQMYDFKAPLNEFSAINTFANQATLDGSTGLTLTNQATPGAGIFEVHNQSVTPFNTTRSDVFSSGFDTVLQASSGTDFVLNDAIPFTGNPMVAHDSYEEIPFNVAFEPATATSGASTVDFQFRPDPALYVAVMCGQLQVVIDDINFTGPSGAAGSCQLNIATQVSGWKSIMGNPDKKRRPSFSSAKRIERKRARDGSKHFPR